MTIEQAIRDMTAEMRNRFTEADCGRIYIEITVSGRSHGDLLIEYRVGKNYSDSVKGIDLASVQKEFFRREGWEETHAPLSISYVEDEDDDIPF